MDLIMILCFRRVWTFIAKVPPTDLMMMRMGAGAVAVFFLTLAFVGEVRLRLRSWA